MLLLIATEMMFFGGLISGYIVSRAENPSWQTILQPSLPFAETAFNTVLLLLSAVTYIQLSKAAKDNGKRSKALYFLLATIVLGTLFVMLQGREWVALIQNGMTTRTSLFGAFFYTIIGAHGTHVVAGLLMLVYLYFRLKKATDISKISFVSTVSLYWYFVVAVWPILYFLVYMY